MMQTEDTMEMDTDCKQGEDEQVRNDDEISKMSISSLSVFRGFLKMI